MDRTNRLGARRRAAGAGRGAARARRAFRRAITFLKAVRERDGATVQRIVGTPGSTAINARDSSTGEGALHILVRGRDFTWLSFLLGRGARPDIQSNDGTTPLILAAQIGWVEGAEQLLARARQPQSRQPPRRDAADPRGPAPRPGDGAAAARRRAPIPTRPTMSPAIRRSIMRGRIRARRRSCASSSAAAPPARARRRTRPRLRRSVEPGEPRIEVAGEPARGAAGEAQGLGLAARGGERPVRRLADHLGVVAVGDDQPGAIGAEAVRRRTARGRSRPAPPSRNGRNSRDSRPICRRRAGRRATP